MSHRQKNCVHADRSHHRCYFSGTSCGSSSTYQSAESARGTDGSKKMQNKNSRKKKIASEDDNSADSTSGDSRNEPTTPEPTGEPVSITVSMVGDCTLGTDINFDQSTSFDAFYQMKNDPGYFFQNVKKYLQRTISLWQIWKER